MPAIEPVTRLITLRHWHERMLAWLLRLFLYLTVRAVFGPPWPPWLIRLGLRLVACTTPGVGGVIITKETVDTVTVETLTPVQRRSDAVLLYLHGGGFVAGCPFTHRALTTRLARQTGAMVWVPDYRLAPEHPYPAGLDDCLTCYRALLDRGVPADKIVVAGDSAGGGLTLAMTLRARRLGLPLPAGLMTISPVAFLDGPTASHRRYAHSDPLIREGLFELIGAAYRLPDSNDDHRLLTHDLAGLPPLLVQVGSSEMLYDDSIALARHAARCGVAVELEEYRGLWHVLHLVAGYLPTARAAIATMAQRFSAWTGGA